MVIDGRGVPLGVAVDGANVHDQKLVASTLDAIPVERPDTDARVNRNTGASIKAMPASLWTAKSASAGTNLMSLVRLTKLQSRSTVAVKLGVGKSNALILG